MRENWGLSGSHLPPQTSGFSAGAFTCHLLSLQVFLKAGVVSRLEKQQEKLVSHSIVLFQAACKGFLSRQEFKKLKVGRPPGRGRGPWNGSGRAGPGAVLPCFSHWLSCTKPLRSAIKVQVLIQWVWGEHGVCVFPMVVPALPVHAHTLSGDTWSDALQDVVIIQITNDVSFDRDICGVRAWF